MEKLLEWFGLAFLISMAAYISWTKMTLGAVLTIIGAFAPLGSSDNAKGTGELKAKPIQITFRNSLRLGVILAGIILIIGSMGDGVTKYADKYKVPDTHPTNFMPQPATEHK